jgi:hypothetical protein
VANFKYLGTVTNQNCIHELLRADQIRISCLPVSFVKTTTILPFVLYGCETWSLTLSEENRLRVFENRVSRGMFGPKREEVVGGWRGLHDEELHKLYTSHILLG